MKAIILAAGRGSRMLELTAEQPKCLLQVKGKPLLIWQIEALQQAGITEIAVVTGYKREHLKPFGLVEFYNPAWASTNMVSSLLCGLPWLEAEPCIVSYSDIFYTAAAINSLKNSKADLAITYDCNWLQLWTKRFGDPLLDAETFKFKALSATEASQGINQDASQGGSQQVALLKDSTETGNINACAENAPGELLEIGHKPQSLDEIQGQYMGLLRFSPTGVQELLQVWHKLNPSEQAKLHLTHALQLILQAGHLPITTLPYTDPWGEIDSQTDLKLY